MKVRAFIGQYAKAFVGGIIAGLASAEAALQNSSSFTARDYIAAILAGLIAFNAVAFIPNKSPK